MALHSQAPRQGVPARRNAMAVLACMMIQDSATSPESTGRQVLYRVRVCHGTEALRSSCKLCRIVILELPVRARPEPPYGGALACTVPHEHKQPAFSRAPCRQKLVSHMIVMTPDIEL
jgi:hypothetical protein